MSLIYLDEDLPEIELREIITGDEFLEDMKSLTDKKKGLNIYTSEEIYNQTLLLLQSLQGDSSIPIRRKTEAFQKLHKEVTTDVPFQIPRNILPEVAIQRKDNGDEDVFFEHYDEAGKIENYEARRKELHRTFLGFETTDESSPQLDIHYPTPVMIADSNDDIVTILPKDTLPAHIKSLHTRKGISSYEPSFQQLTLLDKVLEQIETSYSGEQEYDKELSMEDNSLHIAKENIDSLIQSLSSIGNLYTLWKDFMEYGIDIDKDISKEQLKNLEKKLRELQQKDKEVYEFLTAIQTYRPKKMDVQDNYGGFAFYVIQRSIFEKIQPILEKLKQDLLQLYQGYLDSYPVDGIDNPNIPSTAYDIAMVLYEDKASLEDVLDTLRMRLLKEQKINIEKWLRTIQSWNIKEIEEKVQKEYIKYLQTQESIHDEEKYPWISVNEAIKEIKKGEVIASEVEDSVSNTMDNVFHPMEEFIVESDNPDEIEIPVYDDNLPIDIQSLDEGTKELFEITLRMFVTLQRVSGLPLDYTKLYANVLPSLRKTKSVAIQEQLPELPDNIKKVLEKIDIEHLEEVMESIIDPILYQRTKSSIRKIHHDFMKDLETQWIYLLGWWICDLQNQVLNRTLQFEIWKGSLNCIQSWSPYGYPMEDSKKKEGIYNYLQCVIYDLVHTKGTIWNQYALETSTDVIFETLDKVFSRELKDTVLSLQTRFRVFEKEVPTKGIAQKGEQVRKQIIETVEQRQKNRYLSDYMRFLKNLPSVLVQSSIAKKMHLGCCLQLLSEKYRSDYDWVGYVKDAYKLKKLFATQRIGYDKRPYLATVVRKPEEIPIPTIQSNQEFLSINEVPSWILQTNWLDDLKTFMPSKEYSLLVANIQNLNTITEKNIDTFLRSVKQSSMKEFIFTANTQTLVEFYRKIIQLQKRKIEEDYSSKPVEVTFLRNEFDKLLSLFELLLDTHLYTDEYQDIQRRRILQYFISRQICFPAKPEFSRNNTLVLLEDNLESSLLPDFLQSIYDKLLEWVIQKNFNTSVNFADYLSKMREQENVTKLKIVDVMNPEERKIYVQAKKLGIQELEEYMEMYRLRAEEEQQNREAADEYEEEGEDEFYPTKGENDDEQDIDALYDDEPHNNYNY